MNEALIPKDLAAVVAELKSEIEKLSAVLGQQAQAQGSAPDAGSDAGSAASVITDDEASRLLKAHDENIGLNHTVQALLMQLRALRREERDYARHTHASVLLDVYSKDFVDEEQKPDATGKSQAPAAAGAKAK